ncbi:hypothetical protein PTKIN_Ptkin18bG0016800 [Pterospermum kingtungense]
MAEELEGVWRFLTITDEEKDAVETFGLQINSDPVVKSWSMAKLLTKRPFNKEAMISAFKGVWRLAKEFEVSCLDSNLFLFKFASQRDTKKGFRMHSLVF